MKPVTGCPNIWAAGYCFGAKLNVKNLYIHFLQKGQDKFGENYITKLKEK